MRIVHRSMIYHATREIVVERARGSPRHRELLIAAAVITYGAFLMVHSAWSATSDRKAAALFYASNSCELRTQDPVSSVASPCRIESAVVVERRWHRTKGDGAAYDLVTRSADGARDEMLMSGKPSILFWRRVTPGETIMMQRFVTPGYRLTGSILALGDKRGWILTPAHPDRAPHNEGVFILLGGVLFLSGTLLAAGWVRRSRRVAATDYRGERAET